VPFGLPGGDTNSDGDCDASDVSQVDTWVEQGPYDVRGDIDLDGDVDEDDSSVIAADYSGIVMGRGVLSDGDAGNQIGFVGYTTVGPGALLHSGRSRLLSPTHGRWSSRDLAEYVDSSNLYLHVRGAPTVLADPLGMSSEPVGGCSCKTSVEEKSDNSCWRIVTGDEKSNCKAGDCGANHPRCSIDWSRRFDIEPITRNPASPLYKLCNNRYGDDWPDGVRTWHVPCGRPIEKCPVNWRFGGNSGKGSFQNGTTTASSQKRVEYFGEAACGGGEAFWFWKATANTNETVTIEFRFSCSGCGTGPMTFYPHS